MIETQVINALAVAVSDRLSLAEFFTESTPSVFKRAVDGTDPNFTIGITFVSWAPDQPVNIGSWEPATAHYVFTIQSLIKHTRREDGEHVGAVLASRIRQLLYRDEDLRLSLHGISANDLGVVERILKVRITGQECMDTPFKGGFAFMSQTELQITTEIA